jgi:hypothetical protein
MLYESASRAGAVLALNVEDLDLSNKQARVTVKGGDTMWITWGTDTVHLLPRLIAGRTAGPLFLILEPAGWTAADTQRLRGVLGGWPPAGRTRAAPRSPPRAAGRVRPAPRCAHRAAGRSVAAPRSGRATPPARRASERHRSLLAPTSAAKGGSRGPHRSQVRPRTITVAINRHGSRQHAVRGEEPGEQLPSSYPCIELQVIGLWICE